MPMIEMERANAGWLEEVSKGAYSTKAHVDRESWMKSRTMAIGSSEAAAVVGMSPYMNEVDLWNMKRGSLDSPSRDEENADMARGHASEPLVLGLYEAETGDRVLWGDSIILRSQVRPFMSATLDGIGVGNDGEPYVIEVKSVARSREEWTDDAVPPHYYLQVLHQLSVTRWKSAILLARFCRTEWGGDGAYERCYHFDYESLEDEIASLEKAEERFWNEYVVGGARPPVKVPEI